MRLIFCPFSELTKSIALVSCLAPPDLLLFRSDPAQPASLTIGGVQLADQCSAVTLTLGQNPLVSTAFGDGGERMVGGLQTVEGTITLYVDYGASSVEAIFKLLARNFRVTREPVF